MHREILNFHLENLEVGTVYRAKVLGLHLCPYAWRVFRDVGGVHSPWRFGPLGRACPCMHVIWSTYVKLCLTSLASTPHKPQRDQLYIESLFLYHN